MKKKILALTLAVVMAAIAIVCVSCGKKEAKFEDGKVSYTVVNNTGKRVTEIILSDTRSENKVVSKTEEGGLPDGQSIGLELPVKLEKNAPDVTFNFTVEGGDNLVTHIMQQSGTITLLTEDGRPAFEISNPGK